MKQLELFQQLRQRLDEVTPVLKIIRARPGSFPVVYQIARHPLIRRFPNAIFFVAKNDKILVVAFLHGRQSPKARLEDRV